MGKYYIFINGLGSLPIISFNESADCFWSLANAAISSDEISSIACLVSIVLTARERRALSEAIICLFGSRARETHREWSDIDLALDAGTILPNSKIGGVKDFLAATNMPYKVDVLDFNIISPTMQEIIKRERKIWKN